MKFNDIHLSSIKPLQISFLFCLYMLTYKYQYQKSIQADNTPTKKNKKKNWCT